MHVRPLSPPFLTLSSIHHPAGKDAELCWPLLMDACDVLSSPGSGGLPLLLAAAGIGPQLAALVRRTASCSDAELGTHPNRSPAAVAAAWAALHCLPHATPDAAQAIATCQEALAATTHAVRAALGDGQAGQHGAILALHAAAATTLATLAAQHDAALLQGLTQQALELVETCPGEFHVVRAAADTLDAARAAGVALPETLLQRLAPALAPNLSQAAAPLRIATLRLLCAFPQPALLDSTTATANTTTTTKSSDDAPQCDALPQLLALISRPLAADSGRQAAVALGRVRSYLEYGRLPETLGPVVVHTLLGILHVK